MSVQLSAGVHDPPPLPLPATWSALLDTLAAQFPLRERSAYSLRFADEPQAPLTVNVLEAHGRLRLLMTAPVCDARSLALHAALELAADILLGGPILDGDTLALRHVLTDGLFDHAAVPAMAQRLRANASHLRQLLAARRAAPIGGAASLFGA